MDSEKWKLNSSLSKNKKFPELQSKFNSPSTFSNFPSKIDASTFFNNGIVDKNNVSFQTNTMTTQRMMAFQSSVNGKMNPSVVAMEKMSFIDGEQVEDTKVLTIKENDGYAKKNELKAIKGSDDGEGKLSKILNKIGLSKKKDECVMKDNERCVNLNKRV